MDVRARCPNAAVHIKCVYVNMMHGTLLVFLFLLLIRMSNMPKCGFYVLTNTVDAFIFCIVIVCILSCLSLWPLSSSLPATGTQFHPALRGAGGGRGRLVSESDGAHRVSTQQPVLQPAPAPLSVQQVAAHAETNGRRDTDRDGWRKSTDSCV